MKIGPQLRKICSVKGFDKKNIIEIQYFLKMRGLRVSLLINARFFILMRILRAAQL